MSPLQFDAPEIARHVAALSWVFAAASLIVMLRTRRGRGLPGLLSGQDVVDAARQASRLRFRAILLTSATTVAGLLPLLAERSLQAQVLIPMAISIVFGILASTVLVLVVVPSLYAILSDFGLTAALGEE